MEAEESSTCQGLQHSLCSGQQRCNPTALVEVSHGSRLRYLVKLGDMKKGARALDLLGCDLDFLKAWFSFNFKDGMMFDNHGKIWHIDHTIPVSAFNLQNEAESCICFHWSNLKPMFAKENMSKKNKLSLDELEQSETMLHKFLNTLPKEFAGRYSVIEIDRHSYLTSNRGATKVSQE